MFYTIIMLLIIGAVVAMVGTEGAWSAALMLINTITAALLAMNFWEPLAALGIGYSPGTEFFIDFFLLTSLFAIIVMVLRTITDKLSRKRPLLPKLADTIGGLERGARVKRGLARVVSVFHQQRQTIPEVLIGGLGHGAGDLGQHGHLHQRTETPDQIGQGGHVVGRR